MRAMKTATCMSFGELHVLLVCAIYDWEKILFTFFIMIIPVIFVVIFKAGHKPNIIIGQMLTFTIIYDMMQFFYIKHKPTPRCERMFIFATLSKIKESIGCKT